MGWKPVKLCINQTEEAANQSEFGRVSPIVLSEFYINCSGWIELDGVWWMECGGCSDADGVGQMQARGKKPVFDLHFSEIQRRKYGMFSLINQEDTKLLKEDCGTLVITLILHKNTKLVWKSAIHVNIPVPKSSNFLLNAPEKQPTCMCGKPPQEQVGGTQCCQ